MLSLVLLHCYKRQGFGSCLISPISGAIIHFMGQVYVDDTDLLVTDPELETAEEVAQEAQASLLGWGNPLNATGGSLNLEKCYCCMVNYTCVDGVWHYTPKVTQLILKIPLPDGTEAPIEQLEVTDARKMLGVWSCRRVVMKCR